MNIFEIELSVMDRVHVSSINSFLDSFTPEEAMEILPIEEIEEGMRYAYAFYSIQAMAQVIKNRQSDQDTFVGS